MIIFKKASRPCNCKNYEAALTKICDRFADWVAGRYIVVQSGETDEGSSYKVDEILAEIRNYALAGLGRYELVPGTPDQHFPVLAAEDRSNLVPVYEAEEPEGY